MLTHSFLEGTKSVKLEVVINFEGASFLETEEHIMNEINKIGQKVTQNAMEKLEIKENKIVVNKQTLYAKKKLKHTNHLMEK